MRTDLFAEICQHFVSDQALTAYLHAVTLYGVERWLFRRELTRNLASSILCNYVLAIGHRFLHRLAIVKQSAAFLQNETLPMVTASGQLSLIEVVPFRLTPSLQAYITPVGIDGVLASALVFGARKLAKPQSDFMDFVTLFVRDELFIWYLNQQPQTSPSSSDESAFIQRTSVLSEIVEDPFEKIASLGIEQAAFLARVLQNCELVAKRAQTLACLKEESTRPTDREPHGMQTALDLISSATNPQKLALMDAHWHPWF